MRLRRSRSVYGRSGADVAFLSDEQPLRQSVDHCCRGLIVLAIAAVLAGGGLQGLAVAAPAHADTGPTVEIGPDRDISFESGGVTIHASYRGPAAGAGASVPAAVIIDGTGGSDRNGDTQDIKLGVYKWLADRLADNGVASIRYDKLGTGETGMGPYEANPEAVLKLTYDQIRIQPVRDALSFLTKQPGVDVRKLLTLGHSEGGITAMGLAGNPGDAPPVAGYLMVEPAASRYNDLSERQTQAIIDPLVAEGTVTAADEAALVDWMSAGLNEIRNGTPPYPEPGPVPLPSAMGETAEIQEAIRVNFYGSDPLRPSSLTRSARFTVRGWTKLIP